MKLLGMQLKIQNDESSLQIWHVESSSCAAVASGFLWLIQVLHFCRRGSMNLEGGQLHMLIPVASCFTCVFYVHRDLWELLQVICCKPSQLWVVKMMKTSFYKRSQVIALSEQGFFQRFIAGHLHIPRSTIGGILARYKDDGRVHNCPRSWRPRLLSIRDERLAVRMLNEPKSGNAVVVGRKLRAQGLRLYNESVRRCFRRQGLGSRVKKKKPLLTKKHRQKRLR